MNDTGASVYVADEGPSARKDAVDLNSPAGPETVVVLSISPIEEDHLELKRIFSHPTSFFRPAAKWTIYPTDALGSALRILGTNPPAIVLSERDLFPCTWRDVLAQILRLSDPPLLIVTSLHADEYLWAEALNLGAFDVLAKPFETEEVVRALSSAWIHRNGREIRNRSVMAMAAAS